MIPNQSAFTRAEVVDFVQDLQNQHFEAMTAVHDKANNLVGKNAGLEAKVRSLEEKIEALEVELKDAKAANAAWVQHSPGLRRVPEEKVQQISFRPKLFDVVKFKSDESTPMKGADVWGVVVCKEGSELQVADHNGTIYFATESSIQWCIDTGNIKPGDTVVVEEYDGNHAQHVVDSVELPSHIETVNGNKWDLAKLRSHLKPNGIATITAVLTDAKDQPYEIRKVVNVDAFMDALALYVQQPQYETRKLKVKQQLEELLSRT
ncbi:hypothetical protein [Burkholderia phage BCSR5]|nr:hypothetical protein [Burkholderia phage BCSR5]